MAQRRPRILILIKGLGRGGAERLIAEGARFWDRDSFDYRVAYHLPWKDHLARDIEALGFPVECLGGRRGVGPGTVGRTRKAARMADLVHAHLPSTGVLARVVSNTPVVYTEHNVADSYRLPIRLMNRLTYSRNRATIAVSEAVGESVARFPGSPVQVIPNGVAVQPTVVFASAARLELGLEATDPLVVHVGNIRPHKGHSNLIAAVTELQTRFPQVTVVSIGGEKHPGDLDRVRAQASQSGVEGSLRFLGSREDALSFLAAADVVVNPSDFEGLPVVLLEALALERPVVATDVGGVGTIIEDNQTGLLIPPKDPSALASAVGRLLDAPDLRHKLAAAGRRLVERDFSLEAMVRRTEDVYRRVLHG